MTIHFQCENCKHPIIAPEEMFGMRVFCPQCKFKIQVPEPGESSEDDFQIVRKGWKVDDGHAESLAMSERLPNGEHVKDRDATSNLVKSKSGSRETNADPPRCQTVVDRPISGQTYPSSVMDKVVISTGKQVIAPTPAETKVQANSSPDALWYVRPASGGQFGPATMTLLRQWKIEGRVTSDSWVWQQGWIDWQPATAVFADFEAPEPVSIVNPKTRVANTKILSTTEYLKARRKRSALVTIGLSLGTIVVAALLLALFFVVRIQGGG